MFHVDGNLGCNVLPERKQFCCENFVFDTNTHTHTFNGPFLGLPGWASTRMIKINLDFSEVRHSEWHWHQLGHMQVCTSLQTDNHASTSPLSFYRPDALPAAKPTASKHCRDSFHM